LKTFLFERFLQHFVIGCFLAL